MQEPGEEQMNRKVPFQFGDLAAAAKGIVVLLTADLLADSFPEHGKVAFGVGLCLGVLIQLAIPPRKAWKKQILILMPIAALYGIVRALFH